MECVQSQTYWNLQHVQSSIQCIEDVLFVIYSFIWKAEFKFKNHVLNIFLLSYLSLS